MRPILPALLVLTGVGVAAAADVFPPARIDPVPRPLASDPSVRVDYDIAYVRAPRFVVGRDGKPRPSRWPEIAHPTTIDPGYDLVLLHPALHARQRLPGAPLRRARPAFAPRRQADAPLRRSRQPPVDGLDARIDAVGQSR